ncbi:MAG: peptide chain release factor N(5)-glutamine methyltransferase [Thermodesulfovibrionales bacterium]
MISAIDGLREVSQCLSYYGIEEPQKEAEIILSRCIGIERVSIYRDNPVLSPRQIKTIEGVLERRSEREPLQYILGDVDFYGLRIKVGHGVLIPRPETELVVEEVLKMLRSNQEIRTRYSSLRILDLCTGSGCIALAIARHCPDLKVYGTDVSEKALGYARENRRINSIKNVTFLKGDLYEPVKGMRFDIIISNPPYIRRMDIRNLQPEIKMWEPIEALDGGEDGLQFYREILRHSADYLNNRGSIIMEVGSGEAEDVLRIAEALGLRCASVIKDYSGIERVLCLVRRPYRII